MSTVSMQKVIQAVRDAREVISRALPQTTDPLIEAAVITVVLREFLDNEYTRDLEPTSDRPRPARPPGGAGE